MRYAMCIVVVLSTFTFHVQSFEREIERARVKRSLAEQAIPEHQAALRQHREEMRARQTGLTLQDWQYEKMKLRKIRDAGRRIAKLDHKISRLTQVLQEFGWEETR